MDGQTARTIEAGQGVAGMLQEHLANSIDLSTHAKQAHWNVKGPDFIALHELFDKVATDSLDYSDLIAERIMQMGGIAEGTLTAVAKRTGLPEYPLNISAGHQHVSALAQTLAYYGETTRNGINSALELNDQGTADIFIEISRKVDKFLWFVEAHLQSAR